MIGLSIALLGIQMEIESNNFIIPIISLVIGTITGEWMNLVHQMIRLGSRKSHYLKKARFLGLVLVDLQRLFYHRL